MDGALLCVGSTTLRSGQHRRQNAAIRPDAEEFLAARVATVRRKDEHALQEEQSALFHSFSGDMLEIEIAALGAMRVVGERERHASCVEAEIAAVAAPGAQRGETGQEIADAAAARAKAISAAALRANHSSDRLHPGGLAFFKRVLLDKSIPHGDTAHRTRATFGCVLYNTGRSRTNRGVR